MNKGGAFILGIIALFGLAVLISKGSSSSRPYRRVAPDEWVRQMPKEATPHSLGPRVVLENDQHIILKRGPDRLLEEIIIHRKVIDNG